MRKRIIIIIAFLLTSSFILFGGFRLLNNTSNTRDIKFSINQGDSLKDISIRLKENDIILEIDGVKIDTQNTLAQAIAQHSVGDEIILHVWHKGEEKDIRIQLEDRTLLNKQ